jgi:hypothetical protein
VAVHKFFNFLLHKKKEVELKTSITSDNDTIDALQAAMHDVN